MIWSRGAHDSSWVFWGGAQTKCCIRRHRTEKQKKAGGDTNIRFFFSLEEWLQDVSVFNRIISFIVGISRVPLSQALEEAPLFTPGSLSSVTTFHACLRRVSWEGACECELKSATPALAAFLLDQIQTSILKRTTTSIDALEIRSALRSPPTEGGWNLSPPGDIEYCHVWSLQSREASPVL